LNATTSSPHTFSEEQKVAIEQQLERLVSNSYFSHSRRFPTFLRYVVSETLAGNTEQLKERTLGIEIFGKDADYDTSTEPIVRVTAAEIRKRIAQYYQDAGHEQEMRLSLPPGSYVPHFEFPSQPPLPDAISTLPPTHPVDPLPQAASHRRLWILTSLLALTALIAAGATLTWRHAHQSAFADFWSPILSPADPVLFCVADQTQYASLSLRDAAQPNHQVELKDNLTAVVIDDLSVIAKIAGVLQSAGHKYDLRGESTTTLMDLRNGPSVIVGAFDNAWTLRLLNPLRFHFANDPAMTTFSIVDAAHPERTDWTIHRQQQLATNNYHDYAIVARFTDNTTGKPTIIAAGIGRGGTIAAGEFLTNEGLLQSVLAQRPSRQSQNLEVVLSTQIIDGEPGTPKIESVYYW
jgi:hypothetical protein